MKWKVDIHNWITDEEENIIAAVTNKEDMAVIAAAPDMYETLLAVDKYLKIPKPTASESLAVMGEVAIVLSKAEGRKGSE